MKKVFFAAILLLHFVSGYAQTLQEAIKLTENEQYEEASEMFKLLIAKSPSDATLYYYYGNNLLKSDNADSAKVIYAKGATIDPANPFIKIGNAKILLDGISLNEARAASEKDGGNAELRHSLEEATGNVNEANRLIDEAVANTKSVDVLVQAADALINYRNKNTAKAKTLLDRANEIDPKNILVNLLLGDYYAEINNGTLAADYYNRAQDLDKTSARAIVSKGKLYHRSTNYEGAAGEFLNAIKTDSAYAPAFRELGETYISMGKLREAKESYRKYLELSRNNCGARRRYASFLFASKNYEEALNELSQALKNGCDSNNLLHLRIQLRCYYELSDTVRSMNSATRFFNLLPREKHTSKDLEYYGKILILNKKDSAGIEQLQKAYALDPTRTELLNEMASGWMKLKQYGNAIELLKQKIAIGKDVKVMDHYSLGLAYYYNRQFFEADTAAAKANDLSPKWASAWLLRARVNSNIDSTSEAGLAKPFYDKYIEIALADSANPSNMAKFGSGLIEAYGYLAYYFILMNDNTNGLEYLKRKLALPLDPEDRKKVLQAIDQLENKGPKKK